MLETGKPLRDCRTEVDRALLTMELSAQEAMRIHGETVPVDLLAAGDGMSAYYTRVPIGVVVGIAGFNYPFLLAMHKIAPAIAAGCPVICKPAPQTPFATLWLAHILREAAASERAPRSLVQVVTGAAGVGETPHCRSANRGGFLHRFRGCGPPNREGCRAPQGAARTGEQRGPCGRR